MSRNNKLYNYLVNTFGISKDTVLQYCNDRIEQLLSKHVEGKLMDSNYIHNLIINQIDYIVKNGTKAHWYNRDSFESTVKNAVSDYVEEKLEQSYSFEVILKPKPRTDRR